MMRIDSELTIQGMESRKITQNILRDWVDMTWQAPLMCSAEPPMPSALCFRLRPAEDLFDRANQQTAVRDCTMDLLAYGTVCCAAHDRQEAAPEDEPEVKHELGGREHP